MKKVLCFAAAAMAIFASCQKTEIVYNNEAPQEIALFAVNKVATKAPVVGATFNTEDNMDVVAYLSEGDGVTPGTFFTETNFGYHQVENNVNVWKGGRYWPISDATLNFLAVTKKGGKVENHVQNEFTTSATKQQVISTLTENDDASQTDLMFAAGQGTHTANGEYTPVSLVFHHALSWIVFNVKTTNTTGQNGTVDPSKDPKITINSITLNNVGVNGTLTIDNPNYNAKKDANGTSICNTENLNVGTSNWDNITTKNIIVDKEDIQTEATASLELTGHPANFGGEDGVLVIPSAQTSFTINYTITQTDNTASTFNYTHALNTAGSDNKWEMGKKYTYNIAITLNEIKIAPEVVDWDSTSNVDVPLS